MKLNTISHMIQKQCSNLIYAQGNCKLTLFSFPNVHDHLYLIYS